MRGVISDFAVMIAIVSMVGADAGLGLDTPKLNVPEDFKVKTRLVVNLNFCTFFSCFFFFNYSFRFLFILSFLFSSFHFLSFFFFFFFCFGKVKTAVDLNFSFSIFVFFTFLLFFGGFFVATVRTNAETYFCLMSGTQDILLCMVIVLSVLTTVTYFNGYSEKHLLLKVFSQHERFYKGISSFTY